MLGTINFFNASRGFGFIGTPEGESFFFHISNFERGSLPLVGAVVAFVLGPPLSLGKREQAVHVRYPKRMMDAAAGELADKTVMATLAQPQTGLNAIKGGAQ